MQIISDKIEAERKFLADVVGDMPECRKLEIFQTYLIRQNNENNRIRRIVENGNSLYIKTTKKAISEYERLEKEWQITPEEYDELMVLADPDKQTIHKVRRCFPWDNRMLELDTFITPQLPHCLLEIEDVAMDDIISFPPFLKIIDEVTKDVSYYNSIIAKQTKTRVQ